MVEVTWAAIDILFQIMFTWDMEFPADSFYSQDVANVYCLSANAYFEARSESQEEQMAVTQVALNRVNDSRWPNDICSVITQKHQFSWVWDDRPDTIHDISAFIESVNAVLMVYTGIAPDVVFGATHYYAHDLVSKPSWAKNMEITVILDGHTYLK